MKKDSKTKEYKEISNALRDDTEEVSDIWDMLDPKMFKFTESEFEDIFHEWWNTQYYDSLEDFCRNGSFEDAHSLYLHLLPHVAESVVTEARFVKDFNRDVLDAKTKDEVLKLYPNAEFFLGKSDHFFGELDDNLFFKAYYTKGQKEFEIKSIYSEKNKNYVHLYNESVVNEKSKFKKRATIFSTVHSDDFDGDVYDITNDVDGSEIYKDTEFKILSIDKDEVILYDKEGDIEYSIDPDDLQYFTESVVNEAKGGQIFPGDYVKTQYGDIYMRVDGKVGKHDAYVRVIRGKVHKRKTALHHTMKLTVVNKDGLEESVTEANTFTDKWEREEAEFKRIIASPDKRVYDLVDYVQFSTGGMTEKDWEKFMYGRYKKNLQSTDSKTKEKMYNVIQKMVLESEMISESATEMLAKEIQDAEYYIAHGDGSTIEARSTKKTWDDGVPVLKYIARGKKQMVKTPKGSFELVVDEKYGWYYWENKGTWYGANIEYGATPPFEF